MRRTLTLRTAGSVAAALLLSGCTSNIGTTGVSGSGKLASETRPVSSFNAVTVSGPFETTITVGSPASVLVTSDDNLLGYIVTEVAGDTLNVHFKNNTSLRNATAFRLEISVPTLTRATGEAAAQLSISGLNRDDFALTLAASSRATASGSVGSLHVEGTAASVAKLADLHARSAQVSLDAASIAELTVAESVSGDARAASVLKLRGNPRVNVSTSAASTVVNE